MTETMSRTLSFPILGNVIVKQQDKKHKRTSYLHNFDFLKMKFHIPILFHNRILLLCIE